MSWPQRPLGSTAFALLLCVGGASIIGRLLARIRPLAPIIATFVLSIAYSMMLFMLVSAPFARRSRSPTRSGSSFRAPIYDTVLAAIIGPLAISIHDRRAQRERVDW